MPIPRAAALLSLPLALSRVPAGPPRAGPPELRAALAARSPRDVEPRWVRLTLGLPAGWHIGAERPGPVGLPTRVLWQLPAGWRVAEVRWPTPRREVSGRDTSYVYAARVVAVDAALARSREAPDGPVRATVSYGLCRDICVPGRTTATLTP